MPLGKSTVGGAGEDRPSPCRPFGVTARLTPDFPKLLPSPRLTHQRARGLRAKEANHKTQKQELHMPLVAKCEADSGAQIRLILFAKRIMPSLPSNSSLPRGWHSVTLTAASCHLRPHKTKRPLALSKTSACVDWLAGLHARRRLAARHARLVQMVHRADRRHLVITCQEPKANPTIGRTRAGFEPIHSTTLLR